MIFNLFHPKQKLSLSAHDIHNHLLPGVDDGFRHSADSLRAIRLMAEGGVRHISFSPHMNPDVYPDESEAHFREVFERFAPRVREMLRAEVPAAADMQLDLAAEYMVVKDFEQRVADHADELLCYPDGSVLIEQSYFYESPNLEQAIFELNMAGKKPILAHPERYLYMSDHLKKFDRIVDMGCRLQMNFMSLSGTYGPASMKILQHLLSHDMYSFVATDLHSVHQLDSLLSLEIDKKLALKVADIQQNAE